MAESEKIETGCLHARQPGGKLINVKFFRGEGKLIRAENFRAELKSVADQKLNGTAECSRVAPQSLKAKINVREYVASL